MPVALAVLGVVVGILIVLSGVVWAWRHRTPASTPAHQLQPLPRMPAPTVNQAPIQLRDSAPRGAQGRLSPSAEANIMAIHGSTGIMTTPPGEVPTMITDDPCAKSTGPVLAHNNPNTVHPMKSPSIIALFWWGAPQDDPGLDAQKWWGNLWQSPSAYASIAEFGNPLVIHPVPSGQAFYAQQEFTHDLHLLYRATDQMVQYLHSAIEQSDWMTGLSQYGVGQGAVHMYEVITDPCPATVWDTDFEHLLINLIAQYRIPAPDENTLYLVFTRPYVTQKFGPPAKPLVSAVDFIGIHTGVDVPHGVYPDFDSAVDSWRILSYAAIPWTMPTTFSFVDAIHWTGSGWSTPIQTVFDLLDANVLLNMPPVTHELAETFVNPFPAFSAFSTVDGCEICDICQHGVSGIPNPNDKTQPYPVSTYWSNAEDTCIASAPVGMSPMG